MNNYWANSHVECSQFGAEAVEAMDASDSDKESPGPGTQLRSCFVLERFSGLVGFTRPW